MKTRLASFAILALLLQAASSPASAGTPPEVTFVTASETERAFLRTYCWRTYDPPFVRRDCSTGDAPVPPGRTLRGLDSIHMRIEHPQEPIVEVVYWKGPHWRRPKHPRTLRVDLHPVVEKSGPAWIVDFALPQQWEQLALELEASWDPEISCPSCGHQWARWRVTLVK